MKKYNFKEIKRSGGPIPEEVTDFVRRSVLRFKNDNLIDMFDNVVSKNLYGNLIAESDGRVVANFAFLFGMCKNFKLIQHVDLEKLKLDKIYFIRSIVNDALDMS